VQAAIQKRGLIMTGYRHEDEIGTVAIIES
jgi:hypothetical protein